MKTKTFCKIIFPHRCQKIIFVKTFTHPVKNFSEIFLKKNFIENFQNSFLNVWNFLLRTLGTPLYPPLMRDPKIHLAGFDILKLNKNLEDVTTVCMISVWAKDWEKTLVLGKSAWLAEEYSALFLSDLRVQT